MSDDLIERTKALKAKAAANGDIARPVPAIAAQAPAISSKLWPEGMRGLPNEILRSALFNARNHKTERADMKLVEIASIGHGIITYTGEELRQDDETIWMQLIHIACGEPAGTIIEFTPSEFFDQVGWNRNGESYERLKHCLRRMQATSLEVRRKDRKRGTSWSMVPHFKWEEGDASGSQLLERWQVTIARELVDLFADSQYARVNWAQRLSLPVGLATWLHGYFSTHKEPFALKMETIAKGAGIKAKRKDNLKASIVSALNNLVEIGFIKSWTIEGDIVEVIKMPK